MESLPVSARRRGAGLALCVSALMLLAGCPDAVVDPPPGIWVHEPPNNELWVVGTTRTITWSAWLVSRVRIELLRGGAEPAELIAADVDATLGTHAWTVTGPAAPGSVIVISDVSVAEETASDALSDPFDIDPAGIYVLGPVQGDLVAVGTTRTVSWLGDAAVAAGATNVRIEISRDNGGSWVEDIIASTGAAAGEYSWPVTDGGSPLPQEQCIIRVSDAASPGTNGLSESFVVYSGILHVDLNASSGGDGLTWATAFQHPQDAMDVAPPDTEVWLVQGTYTRRNAADTVLVTMAEGVALYGGFVGTETARGDRDWDVNVTVLDGEDLCSYVVVGADQVVLDGVTVTQAKSSGMYNYYVDTTVQHCVFSSNGSSPGSGGGLCSLGGVFVATDCSFADNSSGGGGGIYVNGAATLNACLFYSNSGRGAGILAPQCVLTISSCALVGNVSNAAGGGIRLWESSADIDNCIFAGNISTHNEGGAVYQYLSDARITNCTFSGNDAQDGSVIYDDAGTGTELTNCVVWGNTLAGQLVGSSFTITYSDIEGGWAGAGNLDADPLFVTVGYWDDNGTPGVPGDDFWVDGDYHIQAGSPCIDAADGDVAPALDLDGNARADDPATEPNTGIGTPIYTDMGAYEYQP